MNVIRRIFDLFFSILGLLVLLPVFSVIAILIKLDDMGSVFFRQERVGYKGKTFFMLKFRTMVKDAQNLGGQLTIGRDPRITRAGYWLRKTKLDEFPQLVNVLRGEMSLVGPRPEVPRYVALYNVEQRRVLDLMPGITDPASIKFHNESEILAKSPQPEQTYIQDIMPEKIRLNLDYARGKTIFKDLGIIFKTLFNLAPVNMDKTRSYKG